MLAAAVRASAARVRGCAAAGRADLRRIVDEEQAALLEERMVGQQVREWRPLDDLAAQIADRLDGGVVGAGDDRPAPPVQRVALSEDRDVVNERGKRRESDFGIKTDIGGRVEEDEVDRSGQNLL